MRHVWTITALMNLVLLPACTDYATFVTATNIGISADTTTQDVSIGYTRAELFTGPGYPEQGEAPRAIGYINSDLHVFQPHIKQLYATGDAAELVTFPTKPILPTAPTADPPYYGQRRPLVFGTGSNVGLQLKFSAGTTPAPSSIKFGYNREEVSIIPMRGEVPGEKSRDKYAPVLASMDMNLGGNSPANTNLGITQFFATGSAARNLAAQNDDIRKHFKAQAEAAVKSSSLVGTYSYDDASDKIRAFWKPDSKTINQTNENKIKSCMTKYNLVGSVSFLLYDRTKAEKEIVLSCMAA